MSKRNFSKEFKSKVAMEAFKGVRTLRELAMEYQLHPNLISLWKKQLIEGIPEIFSNGRRGDQTGNERKIHQLYEEVGELQYELSWLKKKSGLIR